VELMAEVAEEHSLIGDLGLNFSNVDRQALTCRHDGRGCLRVERGIAGTAGATG
jgi:hypothetical protein